MRLLFTLVALLLIGSQGSAQSYSSSTTTYGTAPVVQNVFVGFDINGDPVYNQVAVPAVTFFTPSVASYGYSYTSPYYSGYASPYVGGFYGGRVGFYGGFGGRNVFFHNNFRRFR